MPPHSVLPLCFSFSSTSSEAPSTNPRDLRVGGPPRWLVLVFRLLCTAISQCRRLGLKHQWTTGKVMPDTPKMRLQDSTTSILATCIFSVSLLNCLLWGDPGATFWSALCKDTLSEELKPLLPPGIFTVCRVAAEHLVVSLKAEGVISSPALPRETNHLPGVTSWTTANST